MEVRALEAKELLLAFREGVLGLGVDMLSLFRCVNVIGLTEYV